MKTNLSTINLYQCDHGFKTSERFLNNHYFLYVHKGIGKFKIGKTTYNAVMGDLFFCKINIGNTIIADENNPFLLTGIDFDLIESNQGIVESLPEKINILSYQSSVNLIHHMINTFKEGKIFASEICNALLEAFIYETIKNSKIGLANSDNIKIKILVYANENFCKPITYKSVSEILPYHKNSINRIFKELTGLSLREYVISLRVNKAVELLMYSNKTISEISELCGYNSPIFFSRQFKDKTGKKPSEYRMK